MAISSLGIGSGVLTADILDQLREADEANILTPLEDKLTLSAQKEEAYSLLSSLMTTLKSSASSLDNDTLYLGRSVSGNTDAVTVKAESGSDVQSFNITNIDKAEKDVWNSDTLGAKSTAIENLGEGTLTFEIDGEEFTIDYTAESSLNDIRDSINEAAGEKMTASVLQVGDDAYKLVITADDVNQAITFTNDTNDGSVPTADSLSNILNLNNIQPAEAATFKYNGIEIERSSNEITDLINGVTITLNQNQAAEDSANISINQNKTAISSEISIFVNSYNSLITNLKDMTNSDRESGAVGIFNGDNFVKSISRDLTNLILSVDSQGNSLVDYGIEVDRNGEMSVDTAVLNAKLAEDPSALEKFFNGDGETDGIFTKLNDKLENYTGFNKLLSTFSDRLTGEQERLAEQYDKRKASLDRQYEILTRKFTAYDAMISQINAQFESLQSMIDAEANSKN